MKIPELDGNAKAPFWISGTKKDPIGRVAGMATLWWCHPSFKMAQLYQEGFPRPRVSPLYLWKNKTKQNKTKNKNTRQTSSFLSLVRYFVGVLLWISSQRDHWENLWNSAYGNQIQRRELGYRWRHYLTRKRTKEVRLAEGRK